MSNYFENFPKKLYKFGDDEDPIFFQKLTNYVDIIDNISQDASTYVEYEILDFERPDTLSHKLYGKSEYEWTFSLMNERLRECGWPLTLQEVSKYAVEIAYPNFVCEIGLTIPESALGDSAELGYQDSSDARNDILAKYVTTSFPIGQTVTIGNFYGEVLNKNIQNSEITIGNIKDSARGSIIPSGDSVAGVASYLAPTLISYGLQDSAIVTTQYPIVFSKTSPTIDSDVYLNEIMTISTKYEHEGVHHYEDSTGEEVDFLFDDSLSTKITNLDFIIGENEKSKKIKVIKKAYIDKIAGEHKRLTSR